MKREEFIDEMFDRLDKGDTHSSYKLIGLHEELFNDIKTTLELVDMILQSDIFQRGDIIMQCLDLPRDDNQDICLMFTKVKDNE